ncbi:MAG: TIGR03118 family protein [Edaphobacter sp.]
MLKIQSFPPLARTACTIALTFAPAVAFADSFTQTNLVSNVPGLAATTDPNLVNPWGVSFSATSPFWVSNQGSGNATLYDGAGNITPLVVAIPGSSTPPSGPTGQVFNNSTGFSIGKGTAATFIFDTLNGTIAAWNGAQGTTAVTQVTTPGAVYTGLTQATAGGSTFLYAANSAGNIQVFDSNWNNVTATTFAGKFTDPNLPAGLVPFNVQTIGGNLYVTYANLGPGGTPLPGGVVDEYTSSGTFIGRIATNGPLAAPWGIVMAPGGFGAFSNDLLIGNFGDGEIDVYNPTTDAFLGTIDGSNGQPLVNDFLWSLETRTGGANDNTDAVYFTAGINDQTDGLFGEITETTPEPATIFGTATGLIALALSKFRFNRLSRSQQG